MRTTLLHSKVMTAAVISGAAHCRLTSRWTNCQKPPYNQKTTYKPSANIVTTTRLKTEGKYGAKKNPAQSTESLVPSYQHTSGFPSGRNRDGFKFAPKSTWKCDLLSSSTTHNMTKFLLALCLLYVTRITANLTT